MQPNGTLYGSERAATTDAAEVLALRRVGKTFGRTRALDDVSLSFRAGTVHGVIGANGAGKSTAIKIIGGVHGPDAGDVTIDGTPVRFSSPADAERAGVTVVHQETQVFPDLTVAQNLTAGHIPVRRLLGVPIRSRRQAEDLAAEMLERLGVEIRPDARAGTLGLAEKKLVQIARALLSSPRLMLLDEPTAALEASQSERVVSLVRSLADSGLAVVFVSHKLDEVVTCSDEVSVLESGHLLTRMTRGADDFSAGRFSELVAGRRLDTVAARAAGPDRAGAGPVMTWRRPDGPEGPSVVEVGEGELVTLAGLLGSGAAQAARDFAGADRSSTAQVEKNGSSVRRSRTRAARMGIGFVPQERKRDGILPQLTIEQNIAISSIGSVSRFGVLSRRAVRRQAERLIAELDIRPADPTLLAGTLSGGNQQKVLLARWLAAGARVLVVEEPTHGIDVGAKVHVNRALRGFADRGASVVVSALESDEFVEISDRYVTFRRGEVVLDSAAPVDLDAVWTASLGATPDHHQGAAS
ncbi:MAG: sugar ABC transporter ATP-binding protein [Aeromicrobium sp.]